VDSLNSRLITFRFGEEFGHDSISVWNGEEKIFHADYISYLPGVEGSSIEQEARIDLQIFVPKCSDPIKVCVGVQCESIEIDSLKSRILVNPKASYDANNNLIIDPNRSYWPFFLMAE
jgi:hypothetical protein